MPGKSKRSNSISLFWRSVISLVGLSMILLGTGHIVLFFVGDTAIADVQVRRFGGSTDQFPAGGRYEWEIDYTFRADDGDVYEGHTRRRGDDMGVAVEREVYYLPQAPMFNALAREVWPNFGQMVLVALGLFLIILMNKRHAPSSRRFKTVRRADGTLDVPALEDYDDSVEEVFQEDI